MEAVSEFSRCFKVSKFRVTLSCTLIAEKPVGLQFAWSPYKPSGLGGQAYRQYRRKRDACIAALAERLGGAVAVGDGSGFTAIGPDGESKAIQSKE